VPKSMTGYGKGEAASGQWRYSVQLKSVNNRFLEAPLKLPALFWGHEAEARAMVVKALSRGKVELSWREERSDGSDGSIAVNMELAAAYRSALEKLAGGLGLSPEIRLDQVSRQPGVIHAAGEDEAGEGGELRWKGFEAALKLALEDMQKSREREGKALEGELRGLLQRASGLCGQIEAQSDELKPLFKEKLIKRLQGILESIPKDDPRIVMEAAMLIDKADIREELVRFRTHLAEFERLLGDTAPVGKKLDFLSQELLREANTMGSKSPDAGLTQKVVGLKTEIEKIKEQIMNLE
jgi:uncharacterized protein (TIGR00255 family)